MERKIKKPNFKIVPMNKIHLSEVSDLHHRCIPNTTPSLLGPNFLMSLYEYLLNDFCAISAVAIGTSNKVVGAITATTNLKKTLVSQKKLTLRIKTAWKLCLLLVSRRVCATEIVNRMKFEGFLAHLTPKPYATILTLFVDPAYRKGGIGQLLITHVKQKIIHPKDFLYVDTRSDNSGALSFYKKCGFTVVTRHEGNTVLKIQA
jgi:ribosomal protein S18 acetylase RimI-like enzyme